MLKVDTVFPRKLFFFEFENFSQLKQLPQYFTNIKQNFYICRNTRIQNNSKTFLKQNWIQYFFHLSIHLRNPKSFSPSIGGFRRNYYRPIQSQGTSEVHKSPQDLAENASDPYFTLPSSRLGAQGIYQQNHGSRGSTLHRGWAYL